MPSHATSRTRAMPVMRWNRLMKSTTSSRTSWGTHCCLSPGQVFFQTHMLVHDLGDHLVLARQLLLQRLDLPLQPLLLGRPPAALQDLRPVLEQLLLLPVKHRRAHPVPVTHVRDRILFQQVLPQNRDLLLRCEMPSFLRHLDPPGACFSCYLHKAFCPVPADSIH